MGPSLRAKAAKFIVDDVAVVFRGVGPVFINLPLLLFLADAGASAGFRAQSTKSLIKDFSVPAASAKA